MIDEVSADNNRLSTLPLELRHLNFSRTRSYKNRNYNHIIV
ncbi:hypothetical protein TT95_00019 [Camelpox virus]|uniref:Uncharacterized protein n=1 Tax=Camelpox virus TaxID=28873 RepID=A0A0K1LD04_9POXV|nr:hypothetical protein TT95_00019 [Camelpox virus]WIG62213.1 hypothetical protein DIBLKBHL_00014 [Camelpox virus]